METNSLRSLGYWNLVYWMLRWHFSHREAASVDWLGSHRSLSLGFSVWLDLHSAKIPPCGVFLMRCRCMPCHRAEKQCLQTWALDSTGGTSNLFWPEPKQNESIIQSWFFCEATHFGIPIFRSAHFLFFMWCRTGHSSRLWHYQDWLCVGSLRWWRLLRLLPGWFLVWTLITHLACSPHCYWSELSEMEATESINKKDTTSESPHHFVFRNKNPQSWPPMACLWWFPPRSRQNPKDPWCHSLLGVQTYTTSSFAEQIGLTRNNMPLAET